MHIRARSTDGLKVVGKIVTTSDPFSRTIAALGVWTNTFSPASKGAGPDRFQGLPGQGAFKSSTLTGPLQNFLGFTRPLRKPGTAFTGYKNLGNGLPGTGSSGQIGALLSAHALSDVNYLHGFGGGDQ